MKRPKNLSENTFLAIFFLFISSSFLIAAFFMPDRAQMLSGLWQIMSTPCKSQANNFAIGGFAATFLNMGLNGLVCTGIYCIPGQKNNSASTLATILTIGFGAWGIHILNMLPSFLGVILYCLLRKEHLGDHSHTLLFSTGIAPLITDLMIRYPHTEVVGFHPTGILLAVFVGILIGFFLPAGLSFSPKVHRGFDLYSAAMPVGMMSFFLNAALYNTIGVELPKGPTAETMAVASQPIVNTFCLILFSLCILFALLLGCHPKDYWQLLTDPEQITCFSSRYGNAVFLMNVGVFGLTIMTYYNLIGATFNGVIFGIVFCMLSTCNSGSHPGNVWPILLGYLLAAEVFGWLSSLAGGTFEYEIKEQAIVVGLCYANGLSPISDKYGWKFGVAAGVMHYLLVTSVPNLHGGFCLYNGGFTAALICIILIPQLERFFQTKEERLKAKS